MHLQRLPMPKKIRALNDLQIKKAKPKDKDYTLRDGEGLYILIKKNGKKIFRRDYVSPITKKRNTYTIGEYPHISLSQARSINEELKQLLRQGIDLNRHKKEQLQKAKLEANKKLFSVVAEEFLEHKRKEVSPKRFKTNYQGNFNNYIIPVIGHLKIDEVNKSDIIALVKRVQQIKLSKDTKNTSKASKAREVFNMLKSLFDYAVHNGYLEHNPTYGIDINQIIEKHHPTKQKAITDERIKDIYQALRLHSNRILALPIEFLALTAVRPANAINLKWKYIDYEKMIILYPAKEMKVKHSDYRLPLTPRVMELLEEAKQLTYGISEYVFASPIYSTRPPSDNSLRNLLRQITPEHSLHGFRSSFQTLAMEHQKEHGCSFEAIEAQLHHTIGSKVTQSYLRSDFLEERRKLMRWWEGYLKGKL